MEKRYRKNAAVIITDGNGRILLCERRYENDGTVQVVQGGIDEGESAETAARRELSEELGLEDVTLIGALDTPLRYDWPEEYVNRLPPHYQGFVGQEQHFFLARIPKETVFVLDGHEQEFSRVWWDTPDTLVEKAWPAKRAVLKEALTLFGFLPKA